MSLLHSCDSANNGGQVIEVVSQSVKVLAGSYIVSVDVNQSAMTSEDFTVNSNHE